MNWKLIVTSTCCAALFSVPAVMQASTLSKADRQFMKTAAEDNMAEAHLGQMAETQATEQSVKDFGKTLSTDHTSAYEGLTELAKKTGETIPKALESDKTVSHLSHLKGKAFDRAFVKDEVQSHKTTIAAFRREADHGKDPDVKTWAKNMIPTLEGHLQIAENLVKHEQTAK